MNATTYKNCSNEKVTASIQPGARWGSVCKEFEKYGQYVIGGREGNVGVGGLTLGGGASFHTGTRGFACDDVKNYENPNLFKALKGGSSNFGIVTPFDMQTLPAAPGGLYGGLLFMSYDQKQAVMEQFVRLVEINEDHPEDTEVVTFTYSGEGPPMIAINAINTAGIANSTSFAPLAGLPAIIDDRKRKPYGTLITDYATAGGKRNVWFSLCFHNDIDIMTKMPELYDEFLVQLQALIPSPDLGLSVVSQPLPKHFATKGSGNNVLGLDTSLTHNSIVWLVQAQNRTGEQEALAHAKLAAMTAKLEAYAEANGKATAWRYLNYVNPAQDPISTYGEENVRFLEEVAAKYDPTGVFQTRIPGGFKISKVVL
ncbi:hypothetical protein BDP55DRAFT_636380 [Colletotrichum godetiae]|uniref:FAD binding domain-containing protein n=1 Tax=Colletotrichum godetiae TaxID=1209918 RepID=A0AAJ0ABF9_9PEZI|nr:uncharacterized protein BDP55DRAFT_636380 [Colletotrichum godetiae]KAK1660065.1 hypothetical protein BDP55DRAFT_636380 [Colletotrichum godetiae]